MKTLIILLLTVVTLSPQTIQDKHRAVIGRMNVSGSPPAGETGEIFADNFETGNLSKWDSYSATNASFTVQTDTVNNGTYAGQFTFSGASTPDVWVSKYIGNGQGGADTIYFRGYARYCVGFKTDDASAGTWFDVLSFYDGTTFVGGLRMKSGATTTVNRWIAIGVSASDQSADNDSMAFNKWRRVEVGWEKGTLNNGRVHVLIDGGEVSANTATNADQTYFVDSIKLGFLVENNQPQGYYQWDDIVIDSTDWVGGIAFLWDIDKKNWEWGDITQPKAWQLAINNKFNGLKKEWYRRYE